MFTKKDLFWSVKGQYPEAKIGQSLADYKDAVAKVLAAKFELSDDVLANNDVKFKMFVRLFCEAISKLMKKFSKNYINMVNSEAHKVFFSKEITVDSLIVQPSLTVQPELARISNMETQTRKNDFAPGLEVLKVSHTTQTPRKWIPQSWKPSLANQNAIDDDDTSGDAFIAGDAIVDADGDTEPPTKLRKVGIRQTQRDAKDLRAEVKSSEVCT